MTYCPQMVIQTGWTRRVVKNQLRTFAKPATAKAGCTLSHMQAIIVCVDSVLQMIVLTDFPLAVYLDNPKATNDLLIKELDRDFVRMR